MPTDSSVFREAEHAAYSLIDSRTGKVIIALTVSKPRKLLTAEAGRSHHPLHFVEDIPSGNMEDFLFKKVVEILKSKGLTPHGFCSDRVRV